MKAMNEINYNINTFVAVKQQEWDAQTKQWNDQVTEMQNNVKKAGDQAFGEMITKIQDLTNPNANNVEWDESEPWVDEPWDDDLEDDTDLVLEDAEPQLLNMFPQTSIGGNLASEGLRMAKKYDSIGRCYAAVADAIDHKVAVFLWGNDAYQAAEQIAARKDFKEYTSSISASQLPSLPAGAVVVWGKTSASPHGHISIASGNGQEYSDHV